MKYIKSFNEAFSQENKKTDIEMTIEYLFKNDIDLYGYKEIWYIQKKDDFLLGELYLSISTNKAVRFNWLEDGIKSNIHSIDVWDEFKFGENPTFTILIGDRQIKNILPEILKTLDHKKTDLNVINPFSERSETESESINQIEDDDLRSRILELTDFTKGKSVDIMNIPMHLKDKYDRLDFLLNRISLDVSFFDKSNSVKYLSELSNESDNYILNITNIIHAINLSENREDIEVDKDEKDLAWRLLIKKYLSNEIPEGV